MGLLSRHTVAHLGHRQHFGSGLFGGQGLRRCSALLSKASILFRLCARHGHRLHLVRFQRSESVGVPVTTQELRRSPFLGAPRQLLIGNPSCIKTPGLTVQRKALRRFGLI